MKNSYTYWRASHPLLFTSIHFLLGVIIKNAFLNVQHAFIIQPFFIICNFTISFILLTIAQKKSSFLNGMIVSLTLINWGFFVPILFQNIHLVHFEKLDTVIIYFRNFVCEKINKTIKNTEANGFALALLLGVKSDMNKELITAYTQLGIIHIIAISGMHLEILFKNLTKLTGYLPRNKLFLSIELVLLLNVVWLYTFMAFASPSIVRASVFFSIYSIGKYLGATSFTLNTIAGGMLMLILINVKGLNHIGLQLSYAAVIGIHLFYKLCYQLLTIDNPIIKFLWSNCCMSLAAQITTIPILALHFHQIAGWVLVSNFVMVPLSNFILYALAILLILPNWISLSYYWGILTEKYILLFNKIVQFWYVHTQTGSIAISMQPLEIVIYYMTTIFLYLWLLNKQPRYLFGVLTLICCLILLKLFS